MHSIPLCRKYTAKEVLQEVQEDSQAELASQVELVSQEDSQVLEVPLLRVATLDPVWTMLIDQ